MHSSSRDVKVQEEEASVRDSAPAQNGPFHIGRSTQDSLGSGRKFCEWSPLETARYAVFIEKNYKKMEGKPHNKLWILHKEMGNFVESRNFRQCKLFHQRLVGKHETIPKIIESLFLKIPDFESLFQKEKQRLLSGSGREIIMDPAIETSNFFNPHEKGEKEQLAQTDCFYRESQNEPLSKQQRIGFPAPSMMLKGEQLRGLKAEKWGQCHIAFMEWTYRLNDLMSSQF